MSYFIELCSEIQDCIYSNFSVIDIIRLQSTCKFFLAHPVNWSQRLLNFFSGIEVDKVNERVLQQLSHFIENGVINFNPELNCDFLTNDSQCWGYSIDPRNQSIFAVEDEYILNYVRHMIFKERIGKRDEFGEHTEKTRLRNHLLLVYKHIFISDNSELFYYNYLDDYIYDHAYYIGQLIKDHKPIRCLKILQKWDATIKEIIFWNILCVEFNDFMLDYWQSCETLETEIEFYWRGYHVLSFSEIQTKSFRTSIRHTLRRMKKYSIGLLMCAICVCAYDEESWDIFCDIYQPEEKDIRYQEVYNWYCNWRIEPNKYYYQRMVELFQKNDPNIVCLEYSDWFEKYKKEEEAQESGDNSDNEEVIDENTYNNEEVIEENTYDSGEIIDENTENSIGDENIIEGYFGHPSWDTDSEEETT